MSKVRVKYTKGKEVKYISHLDILRTFHRATRRAGIPVKYSQGFNPHPMISFGLPLPVGSTSVSEFLEMELEGHMEPKQIINKLNNALPAGIRIVEVIDITDTKENVLGKIGLAEYCVTIHLKDKVDDLLQQLQALMGSDEIMVEKKSKKGLKKVNIRPDIYRLDLANQQDDQVMLNMSLSAGSESNLKPELVLQALEDYIDGLKIDYAAIHRTNLWIKKNNQVFSPMDVAPSEK